MPVVLVGAHEGRGVKRSPLKRKPRRTSRAPAEWTAGLRWTPCEACRQARSVHAHHIVTAQECRRSGAPLWDLRNRMLLCFDCHAQHHARRRVLRLPDDHPVHEFAAEHGLTWWVERAYWHEGEDA